MRKIFYLVLLSLTLLGCYGLNNISSATVDGFGPTKTIPLKCRGPIITAKTTSLNAYYGFPSQDRISLVNDYTVSGNDVLTSTTFGLVGFRTEHWVAPSSKFPFRIIGLGVDYSFNKTNMTYTSSLVPATVLELDLLNHHVLGSVSVITFLRNRMIGYFTFQGGVIIQKNKLMLGQNLMVDYRLGYGGQYYLKNNLGLTFEAGYGGGAYVKSGIVFWPF